MKKLIEFLNHINLKDDIKLFSGTGLLTFLRLTSGLVIIKIVAVISGPSGIAIYGQVQNFALMLNGIFASASGDGVIKLIAQNQNDQTKIAIIKSSSILILVSIICITIPLIFFFRNPIFAWINVESFDTREVFIFFLGAFMAAIGTFFISVKNGLQEFRTVITVNIKSILISLFLSSLILIFSGDDGIIFIPSVYLALIGALQVFFVFEKNAIQLASFMKLKFEVLKELIGFMLITFTSFVVTPFVLISIRSTAISQFGLDVTGDWESSRRILELVTAILTAYFAMILLPKVAKIEINHARKIILINAFYITVISIFGLIFCYYFRSFIYMIVYTPDFNYSLDLLVTRIFGEFLRNLVWIFGLILVAKAMFKIYILASLFNGFLLLYLSNIFVSSYGIIGLNYAYFVTNLTSLIIGFLIFLKLTEEKKKNYKEINE